MLCLKGLVTSAAGCGGIYYRKQKNGNDHVEDVVINSEKETERGRERNCGEVLDSEEKIIERSQDRTSEEEPEEIIKVMFRTRPTSL